MVNEKKLKSLCECEENRKDTFKWQMREALARKMSSTIWGQGYILESDNEELLSKFTHFEKINKFKAMLPFIEKYLSLYGRCVVTMNKTKSGEIMLNIPNPFYFTGVGKVFVQPQLAVVWQRFIVDNRTYIVKTTYDCHKAVNDLYTMEHNQTIRVFDKEAQILQELQLDKVWNHNLGFVPVVEFVNLPFFQFVFNNLEFSSLADWYPATMFEDLSYTVLENLKKELIYCHSRIIISNASQELMDTIARVKNKNSEVDLDDFIIETDIGGEFKPQPGNGDFTKYTATLDHLMDFYFKFAGNSRFSEGGGAQKTVAETATVRSSMIESITSKIMLRQEQCIDLIRKVLCAYGVISDYWNNEEEFKFTILGNITRDESSFIDNQIKLVETGAQSVVGMIQKVFNVSKTQAEATFEEVKAFNEENGFNTSMSPMEHEEGNEDFNSETGQHKAPDKNGEA